MNRMIGYAALCAAVLASGSAGATTYDYVGQPFVSCGIPSVPCNFPGMTGSVTFDFDTLGFSGVIDKASGHITSLRLLGATDFNYESFTFDNAAIVGWSILDSIQHGIGSSSYDGDFIVDYGQGGFPPVNAFSSHSPGAWSPVPGPIAGAGLPGLILAIGGLLTWRRRRYG